MISLHHPHDTPSFHVGVAVGSYPPKAESVRRLPPTHRLPRGLGTTACWLFWFLLFAASGCHDGGPPRSIQSAQDGTLTLRIDNAPKEVKVGIDYKVTLVLTNERKQALDISTYPGFQLVWVAFTDAGAGYGTVTGRSYRGHTKGRPVVSDDEVVPLRAGEELKTTETFLVDKLGMKELSLFGWYASEYDGEQVGGKPWVGQISAPALIIPIQGE